MSASQKLDLWPFFLKHPGKAAKLPESMCGSKLDRPKAVCKRCFKLLVDRTEAEQKNEMERGKRTVVQTREEISLSLWNGPPELSDGRLVWIQGRVENISRHLKDCPEATEDERQLGLLECLRLGIIKPDTRLNPTAGVRRTYEEFAAGSLPDTALSIPFASSSSNYLGPNMLHVSPAYPNLSTSQMPTPSVSPSPTISEINSLRFFPLGADQNAPSNSNSPLLPTQILSPLVGGTSITSGPPASKRMRTSSNFSRVPSLSQGSELWTQNKKDDFCRWLARITASCGFPFIWVENPVWRRFCANYIPQAPMISRNTLANRWIPEEVSRYRQNAIEQSRGSLVTIQCDGWTGINSQHYIAFMIGTDKRQVHPIHVHDASNEPRTAANLYNAIKNVRQDLEQNWGVEVIGICSDSSGESLKARKLALEDSPELMVPSCYAHQVALVVGDYFRKTKEGSMMVYADKANDLISYLRSRTQVLAKIRQIQESDQEDSATRKKILLPIRPVITRWTAHFVAYERLLQIRWVLETLVRKENDQPLLLTGTSKSKEKAQEMINVIKDPNFWHQIVKMKKHLEPLARASCILQASHTRLDQVAIIFGTLYKEYMMLMEESGDDEDNQLIQAILDSLDKRWKNTDQDICIAAIFCNPLYKSLPFSRSHHLSVAGMWALFKRLWNRFYKSDPSPLLFTELREYRSGSGQYEHLTSIVSTYQEISSTTNVAIDPLVIYSELGGEGLLPIIARRLLSIVANSASCERLFSMFGITLSRLRSRLRTNAMTNLATLRMYLREEHVRYGLVKERLQRNITSHSHAQLQPLVGPANNQVDSPQEEPELEATHGGEQFSELTGVLAQQAEVTEDQDASEGDHVGGSIDLSLPDVFNFENSYWMDIWQSLAMRNLADEVEFHELVDLDGEAEVDNGDEADITFALF